MKEDEIYKAKEHFAEENQELDGYFKNEEADFIDNLRDAGIIE
jgi:hypothetical protein